MAWNRNRSNDQETVGELSRVVKEFNEVLMRHGQLGDLKSAIILYWYLDLLDRRLNSNYKQIIFEFITISRNAIAIIEPLWLKHVRAIAEGLQHKTEVIEQHKKRTPIL